MNELRETDLPFIIAIAGASGDLTHRKPVPALFDLFVDGWLPERFSIIGIDRLAMDESLFREHLREGVEAFARHRGAGAGKWDAFAGHCSFMTADGEGDIRQPAHLLSGQRGVRGAEERCDEREVGPDGNLFLC